MCTTPLITQAPTQHKISIICDPQAQLDNLQGRLGCHTSANAQDTSDCSLGLMNVRNFNKVFFSMG